MLLSAAVPAIPAIATDAAVTIVVIANKDVALNVISRDDLRTIFQTKKVTWPDGSRARPFNLPHDHRLRRVFDVAVLGLEPELMARYWIDRRIRGGDRPPNLAPSTVFMVRLVSALPGAVGYVDADAANASVKVIAKIVNGQVLAP